MKRLLNLTDWMIVLALVGGIVGMLFGFPYPWVHPLVWEDAATGVGIRAPAQVIPGLGRAAIAGLSAFVPPGAVPKALLIVGKACGGLLAIFTWLLLNEILPDILRRRMRRAGMGRLVTRCVLALGTVFFVCNPAVWRAMQCLSVTTIHLLLIVAALWCVSRFMICASISCVYWATLCWGLLAGDSVLGFAGMLATGLLVWYKSLHVQDMTMMPIGNPIVRVITGRRMSLLFLIVFVATVTLNVRTFLDLGGSVEGDSKVIGLAIDYVRLYGRNISVAVKPVGWFLSLVMVFAPLVLGAFTVGFAVDNDRFLPWYRCALFLAIGMLTWTQICGFSSLSFRLWAGSGPLVTSELAIALFALLDVVAFLYAVSVLAVDVYGRDFRTIFHCRFQDAAETEVGQITLKSFRKVNRYARVAIWCLPFLLLLSVVPMRWQVLERKMLGLLAAGCHETANECGTATQVFTDGALDAGVELAAYTQGKTLYALSMMGLHSDREVALRQRGVKDEGDLALLESGAASALRAWAFDQPEKLTNAAVQVGLELWRRNKDMDYPEVSGLVARPKGMSKEDAQAGIAAAHELEKAILDIYKAGKRPAEVNDPMLSERFQVLQWRLSRMSLVRSNVLSVNGQIAAGQEEEKLMNELDKHNASLDRIRRSTQWLTASRSSQLMPREGLKLCLDRADFKMAETFAHSVLMADPDDTMANFALGMNCFFGEEYGRAAQFLRKVLLRKPEEPSVLNNLAVIAMRTGHYDEAVAYAEKAVKFAPKAPEIKRSLERARKLQAEHAQKTSNPQNSSS